LLVLVIIVSSDIQVHNDLCQVVVSDLSLTVTSISPSQHYHKKSGAYNSETVWPGLTQVMSCTTTLHMGLI